MNSLTNKTEIVLTNMILNAALIAISTVIQDTNSNTTSRHAGISLVKSSFKHWPKCFHKLDHVCSVTVKSQCFHQLLRILRQVRISEMGRTG